MPGRLQMRFRGYAAGGGGRDGGGRAGGVGRSRRDAKRAESVSLLPNPVYVKPAGVDGAVRGGRLRQTAPETEAARHRPIDHFSAAWPKITRNGWDGSFYPAPGRTVRGA